MQSRKFGPALLKHNERASVAFINLHDQCEKSFKSVAFWCEYVALPKEGAICFFLSLMASVTFFPSGNLLFRDEAEQINGRLNQVNEQSYSNLY